MLCVCVCVCVCVFDISGVSVVSTDSIPLFSNSKCFQFLELFARVFTENVLYESETDVVCVHCVLVFSRFGCSAD